jgi:hypothetical protein
MKGKLIDDKMLRTYVKELGCKHPISWAWGCKGGVFQLNGGDYNPWGGWRHHIDSSEHAPRSSKIIGKIDEQ